MATKKSGKKKSSSKRKYSKAAGKEVETEMHHMRSGKHKVKSRKQAIAIGLSKARQKGEKAPPDPNRSVPKKKSSRKKPGRKKPGSKSSSR